MRSFGGNRYGISFANRRFLDAAIAESPYCVNGCSFILQERRSGMEIEEIWFDKIAMWIQIHKFLRQMMTRRNIEMIDGKIGSVIAVEDPFADGLGRGFVRARVSMDVDKPLTTELPVRKAS